MESPHTLVHEPARADSPGYGRTRRIARSPPVAREARALRGGDLMLGRYRLLERLGAGGFGVVWSARDELLHREVALKQIPIAPDGDSDRATREALAAARLAHPAIVALYEACVVEDACYLISELIEGETLARLIAEGECEDRELLEIGLALVSALTHAHARGVIHRDIKPQNVLIPSRVQENGAAAKLTDFGGASLVGEDGLTRTGDVLGTLAYMAPEQSEGEDVGVEADVYALALVLYEAFSGVNPVRGATPAATARRIGGKLDSLSRHRRDLPRELIDALDDALAPVPEDRGSLEDLRHALEDALAETPQPTRNLRGARERRVRTQAKEPATREATLRTRVAGARRRPRSTPLPTPALALGESQSADAEARRRLALPRSIWLAALLLLVAWEIAVGRAGVGLIALAALAPVLVFGAERRRLGIGWLAASFAPLLGVVGLAAAFPALAGQATRWRERALLGALGYWWLTLAEPLLARRLWLGPAAAPGRSVWEGAIDTTAVHVIGPLLTLGLLLGALLWAAAAVVLPWLVRGRTALADLAAAALWTAAVLLAAPLLDAGLTNNAAHPAARGAVLGAILGALLAVAARALRGPV